jgi:hypothetical protein
MNIWQGKLYVFKGEDGRDYVSAALPTERVIEAYQASGPYMPISWPKPAFVGDVSNWMDGLRKKGFSFEPCSIC